MTKWFFPTMNKAHAVQLGKPNGSWSWAPMTIEQFREIRFFQSLDGLRALAVLMVISWHYGGADAHDFTGWLGVHVFFVLSGFLITTLLLRENDAHGSISLRNFYVRRVFRIMPVYYLVFALVIWKTHAIGGDDWTSLKRAIPFYATFFNESPSTGWAPWKLTWTMGIEWKFYMVWPVLTFVIARTASARIFVVAVLILAIAAAWSTRNLFYPYTYSVLVQGGVLALIMNSRRGFTLFANLTRPAVSVVVMLAFIGIQTQISKVALTLGDINLQNLYGLAVVVLIPAILGNGLPQRILSSAPFVFIGRRSFSLYLVQELAWQAVQRWTPWVGVHGWAAMGATTVVGLGMAEVLYRMVERPMIAFGRRLELKLGNTPSMVEGGQDLLSQGDEGRRSLAPQDPRCLKRRVPDRQRNLACKAPSSSADCPS